MGDWREVKTQYGPREEWTPEFAGDWPVNAHWMVGVPEMPCARCNGRLHRWTVPVNADAIQLAERTNARAARSPKIAPVAVPSPVTAYRYEFSHYRDCVPSATSAEVTLIPPRRV